MGNKEDFHALLEKLSAIPEEKVKAPDMPVETSALEAEDLYEWAQKDKGQLAGAGLDMKYVDELPVRAGALREANSNWDGERFSNEEVEKEWKHLYRFLLCHYFCKTV